LQEVTKYQKSGWYTEGGCDTIPAVRDSYFFLPVQAEVGPYFQCPGKSKKKCKKNDESWVFPSPFDCKASPRANAFYDPQVLKTNAKEKANILIQDEFKMPIKEYVDEHAGDYTDLRLFAEYRAAKNTSPILAKIFGSSVVLLCVSLVCTALSRSRRASSAYDVAEQVENGQAPLIAHPDASLEAPVHRE